MNRRKGFRFGSFFRGDVDVLPLEKDWHAGCFSPRRMELNAELRKEVAKLWAALDAPDSRGFWARALSFLRGLMV